MSFTDFGKDEIDLLAAHFNDVLVAQNIDLTMLQSEWEKVKNLIYSNADWEKKLKSTSWKALNRSHSDQLPNVLGLIDLILTIPASTAECERGFSGMKRVKSDWRARLNTSTLSDLLLVLLEGPSIDDFEPLRACQLWADHCDRRPIKRSANRKKWTRKEKKDTPDSATSSGSAPASTSSDTAPAEDNFETRFEQMVEEIVLPEEEDEDFSSVEDLCSSDSSSSDSEEEEEDED